jgi:hypothetical protein
MSFQNLAPCLSQVEAALNKCLSALNAEHPVSVSKSDVRLSRITNTAKKWYLKPLKTVGIKNSTTGLLVSLLATCQPSYAITKSYPIQISDNNVSLDKVAVSGNYGRQERKKLLKPVQHRTIADVFLCLSFISLPFMGELRLAIAFIALWWGGDGNKPFIRRILSAVVLRFLTLPAALHLGQIIKTTPVRKV